MANETKKNAKELSEEESQKIEEQAKEERAKIDAGETVPPADMEEAEKEVVVQLNPVLAFRTRAVELSGHLFERGEPKPILNSLYKELKGLEDADGNPYIVKGGDA